MFGVPPAQPGSWGAEAKKLFMGEHFSTNDGRIQVLI